MKPMSDKAFFDTNVLLYLVSQDVDKYRRSTELLDAGGVISVQVLNEMIHVNRRKLAATWSQVDQLLASVRRSCQVVSLDEATYDQGRLLAERYQLSIYDAMIVAAARRASVKVLYSEDMQDGLVIDKTLTVRNPFAK
jgi:predicted nucleic acid-binding protein